MNQDKIGEADGMNLEVDSKDEVMHRFKLALKTFLLPLTCVFSALEAFAVMRYIN